MGNGLKVHFMGIGGSGMSAVAGIAKGLGYDVDGCDASPNSAYVTKLRKIVKIKKGHSTAHLAGRDLLVVSPAIYYKYPPESELKAGKSPITWQEFLGKFLLKDKEVVAISGTHGKSTTAALVSLVFEKAGMDPTCMIGAGVKEWGQNYRIGKGGLFVVEADEFYDNFLNYLPDAIVLNNIEFDHPDYFRSSQQLLNSFKSHILTLKGKKILVANIDSDRVRRMLPRVKDVGVKIYTYSLKRRDGDLKGKIIEKDAFETRFRTEFRGQISEFVTSLAGDYNVSNILGVVLLCTLYSIKPEIIQEVLTSFNGIRRRMDLIGIKKGVFVYDDYAHHPTAIKVTLEALRQKHPSARIIAVVEPHSYSRIKKFLKGYMKAFGEAYQVIVAPVYQARDKEDYGMSAAKLAKVIPHDRIGWGGSFEEVVEKVTKEARKKDVVIVMGAGKSSELAKEILDAI